MRVKSEGRKTGLPVILSKYPRDMFQSVASPEWSRMAGHASEYPYAVMPAQLLVLGGGM